MTLKAYIVFDRNAGPQEGASLAFARTSSEARRIGWKTLQSWFGTGWTEVRSRWLPSSTKWLAEQESVDLEGEPRIIDSPRYCERCELWGTGPLDAEGICEHCREDEEIEEEA